MDTPPPTWSEDDSRLYRELAAVAVPARDEQIAALLTLLPFGRDEPFHAVELGSGEGRLAAALLDCFPAASLLALDGSAAMRAETARRLEPFGSRARASAFDLFAPGTWLPQVRGADAVLTSLVLHHLSGPEKASLYRELAALLSGRAALLIADLVEPARPEARALFAATWDRSARSQSLARTGSDRLFQQFAATGWNYFRHPDPMDRPSPLYDQLAWLQAAGFATVDCFWLQAGHAIYGGYHGGAGARSAPISYDRALEAARRALAGPAAEAS